MYAFYLALEQYIARVTCRIAVLLLMTYIAPSHTGYYLDIAVGFMFVLYGRLVCVAPPA